LSFRRDRFFLFCGLPAFTCEDENVVFFSPYNATLGILANSSLVSRDSQKDECRRLGCFGQPSTEGPSLPENFDLTLIVTNDCNLRCKYCFARGGENRDYMTVDTAQVIVDNVFHKTERDNIKVSFFGGEPTLNMQLIKAVVQHVSQLAPALGKGYSFYITTNGVVSERTLSYLIEHEFTFVVSSDGPPRIQDFLRPGINAVPSSARVARTITTLKRHRIPFKVRATVTAYNVAAMSETVQYLADLGVDTVHFEPITHAGRAGCGALHLQRAGVNEYLRAFSAALDEAKRLGVAVISSSYMNFLAPSQKFCDAMAGSRLVGSYAGDITLCVEVQDNRHPYSPNAVIGKIDPSTKRIDFNHGKYRDTLNSESAEPSDDCNSCFARFSCGGGCPVKHFYASGCAGVDAYRCALTQGIMRDVLQRIYKATIARRTQLYQSPHLTLYRMEVPGELWMKRKTARITQVLAEMLIDDHELPAEDVKM